MEKVIKIQFGAIIISALFIGFLQASELSDQDKKESARIKEVVKDHHIQRDDTARKIAILR